jgi:hypothetical protein
MCRVNITIMGKGGCDMVLVLEERRQATVFLLRRAPE